jgi:hypothetical protein
MAMRGLNSPDMTMKIENICMPLPIIHIMKHMNPTCLKGAVAVDHSACAGLRWGQEEDRRGEVG